MARKKKIKSTLPPQESPYIEFDAAYLVKRLALFKGVLLKRAVRKDCASYVFTATPDGKVKVGVINLQEGLLLNLDVLACTGVGQVMIDAAALNALLWAFAEPRFRLHLGNDWGQIHAGYIRTKAVVPGFDPEKELKATAAPSLTSTGWIVRGSSLATALGVLDKSRDPTSTRYALGSIALVFPEDGGEHVEMISTDGRRLCRYKILVKPLGTDPDRLVRPGQTGDAGLPLLPDRAIAVAKKLAALADENGVALCVVPGTATDLKKEKFTPGMLQVVTRDAVLTASQPEGRFPRYQDIFPTAEPTATVTLDDASRLGQLVDTAAAATDSENKGVELVAAGGCIMISARSEVRGKVDVSLANVTMTGKFTSLLDGGFLKSLFDVVGQDELTIKFFDQKSPVLFESGQWLSYLLMPLTRDDYTPPKPKPEAKPDIQSEVAGASPAPTAEPEPAPAKKPRRGRKPKKDDDQGGSAPVDPTPEPEPVTPVAATAGGHERNGRAKPKARGRGKTS
jgi:hypothetical protein